ncbi:MAG TPA: hypothetical protein VEK07_16420 [Polyangiaceae bacterium]|nr:hypothetical protein [Polyangiaceae bacterium]
MATQFFARVQFQGIEDADDDAYETLAEEMTKQGFVDTIALPKRVARLPLGTFVAAAERIGTSEEALRRAQLAAKSTGLASSILVLETDRPVQTFGLDNAPPPPVSDP